MNLNQQYYYATPEVKLKMFFIHNVHFSGSNCWDFSSKNFQQLCNSFNTNIRMIFNLHRETSCWLVESLTNGRLAKKMIYSRFLKFITNLLNNRRSIVRALGSSACKDIRTLTGRNLHSMKEDTKIVVRPGITSYIELLTWRTYQPPENQEWKLPLMISLLEIRDSNWEVLFDDDLESIGPNIIQIFLDNICINR